MSLAEILKELIAVMTRLSSLESRTEDVSRASEENRRMILSLSERLTRLETQMDSMKSNVKNEILAEMNYTLGTLQARLDMLPEKQKSSVLPSSSSKNE